jgi:hypothetical protein
MVSVFMAVTPFPVIETRFIHCSNYEGYEKTQGEEYGLAGLRSPPPALA